MAPAEPPGVCVAGMHRAGTSMVARLLNLCGLWLGPDDELVPPAPDNPAGFWEHAEIVGLNEILLAAFGGTWDRPPPLPPGWADAPALLEMRLAAAELTARLAAAGHWGWKDPRNSLTVPFWRRIVPGLRLVVCVRHPLEVAASLHRRDGLPLATALALWTHYYGTLLDDTHPDERIVTHYDAFFARPAAELARLLAFLDLPADVATMQRALSAVGDDLRHQRAVAGPLDLARMPHDVAALYAQLRAEADADSPAAAPIAAAR